MPKPKTVTPANANEVIGQSATANQAAQTGTMAQNTIGQSNPYGDLSYTTTIDPITGKPKYQANMAYTPGQQNIFDILQSNQTGIGTTAQGAIGNVFSQYGGEPNLVGQAGSLTNQALDLQLPAWERFDAPARAQEDTRLENAGILKGTPAYQQAMDALTNQQGLTRGAWLSGFQPQAFNEAQQQYELPLMNVAQMLGLSQPGSIVQNLTNTPQANLAPADVTGAYTLSQDAQKFNAQQNNAYWNNILSGGTTLAKAYMGMPSVPGGGGAPGGQ